MHMMTVSLEKMAERPNHSHGKRRATEDAIVTRDSTNTVGCKRADVRANVTIPQRISDANG
jgi:hypothetical protein